MDNNFEARLAALEKELADAKLQIARHQSAQEIMNLMAKYENLHSAHRWKEQEECFALKTPGVRAIFNGNVYEGAQGIRNHYTGLLQASEQGLAGRIYCHELLTPAIEVAADNESAKGYFSSLGCESLKTKEGIKSLWSFCKFRFGFVKEDGEWKIYRMDMHGTFNTPFDGPGWGQMPYLVGFAGGDDIDNWDPKWAPNAFIDRDENDNPLYVTLQTDTPYCDLHNFQPEFIKPYETWDEGWGELYTEPCKKGDRCARKVDPTATYVPEPFQTVAKPEEYPDTKFFQ